MKKLLAGIISNVFMILVPLLPSAHLMLHPKILIIIGMSICLWLTQPLASIKETSEKKASDRFSVVFIFAMSFISVSVPIILWAYYKADKDAFGLVSATGVCIVLTGIILRAWSVRVLGKYFTPTAHIQQHHQLIMHGPYKLVRHPGYLGALLAIAGCPVILHSWVGCLIALTAMGIAYTLRIAIEENMLIMHFGVRYNAYKLQTKKIIPYVW